MFKACQYVIKTNKVYVGLKTCECSKDAQVCLWVDASYGGSLL